MAPAKAKKQSKVQHPKKSKKPHNRKDTIAPDPHEKTTSNTRPSNTLGAQDEAGDLDAEDAAERPVEFSELEQEIAAIRAALQKEKTENAELRRQIHDAGNGSRAGNTIDKPVPCPKGSAGMDFSIQQAMGLAGKGKKYETYKAIQRNLRDLTLNARINWEVPWAQVPTRDKAKLFDIAREQHPFLAQFERDWATEEIVKQFVKNKRKNHYANGWLEVLEKFAYLKENSMKRNPAASHLKRTLREPSHGQDHITGVQTG